MATAPLKTKIHVPKLRSGLVGRTRLLNRLDEGLLTGKPFSLISAPAGYGKTTLVTDWFGRSERAHAWLSLDDHDNDPIRFITYLIAALQTVDPNMGQGTTALLSGSGNMIPVQSMVENMINEILATPEPFILVLDDFHAIRNGTVIRLVQTLLDHHPSQLHLVMITREDPALSLPRLRVRDQMTEIRMDDLRFDSAETKEFFTSSIGLDLKDEEIDALESRTEGWIAGLQLAALSIKGWTPEQVAGFVRAFSGNHRYIIDYLMEEVIKRTDPGIRGFLTHTAVVDRFNAELADYLTDQCNAKATLAQLEQANLFLVPLDNECRWYRYHHLFAQFLRTESTKAEIAVIQQRAAVWFADNGLPEEGIGYALAAGDYDLAGNLIKTLAPQVFQRGEMVTLLDWLNTLPHELVDGNIDLMGYKAWSLFLLGKSEEAIRCMVDTERISPENRNPLAEGRLLALQGWIANYRDDPRTKEIAMAALERSMDQNAFFLEISLISLGHAQRKNDRMSESTATLYEAYDSARGSGHMFTCMGALLDIAMNLVIEGKRKESMELCNRSLEQYADKQGRPLPMAELLYIPLGILEYEGDNLEQARDYLDRGIKASHGVGMNRILGGDAEQILSLVHWAMGDIRTAGELLGKAAAVVDPKAFPLIRERYGAFQAHLSIKQGDMTRALAWVESSGLNPADDITSFKEIPFMVMARTMYRAGRYEKALGLLDRIREFDRERGRYGRLVYANVISSLVLQALGRQGDAISLMEEAVDFAAEEGYIRPFLSEGPEVGELLLTLKTSKHGFLSSLLTRLAQNPGGAAKGATAPLPGTGMIEPLGSRELEVLRLMASGYSNEGIGKALFISLGTVKWHVKNIFGKLGVGNRTQAVVQAQRLGLV